VAVESEREQARQMLDAERQRMQAAIETERARIGRNWPTFARPSKRSTPS
jgi:hypothetical protein